MSPIIRPFTFIHAFFRSETTISTRNSWCWGFPTSSDEGTSCSRIWLAPRNEMIWYWKILHRIFSYTQLTLANRAFSHRKRKIGSLERSLLNFYLLQCHRMMKCLTSQSNVSCQNKWKKELCLSWTNWITFLILGSYHMHRLHIWISKTIYEIVLRCVSDV